MFGSPRSCPTRFADTSQKAQLLEEQDGQQREMAGMRSPFELVELGAGHGVGSICKDEKIYCPDSRRQPTSQIRSPNINGCTDRAL